jgi:hypothetical protein
MGLFDWLNNFHDYYQSLNLTGDFANIFPDWRNFFELLQKIQQI